MWSDRGGRAVHRKPRIGRAFGGQGCRRQAFTSRSNAGGRDARASLRRDAGAASGLSYLYRTRRVRWFSCSAALGTRQLAEQGGDVNPTAATATGAVDARVRHARAGGQAVRHEADGRLSEWREPERACGMWFGDR